MSMRAIALGAAVAASILIFESGQARAQPTCSDFYQQCVSHPKIKNPQSCVAAKARCMKTGTFIGPETGRNYGTAQKIMRTRDECSNACLVASLKSLIDSHHMQRS
jgi:hypothetical protein